jgi:hypothetical protein
MRTAGILERRRIALGHEARAEGIIGTAMGTAIEVKRVIVF